MTDLQVDEGAGPITRRYPESMLLLLLACTKTSPVDSSDSERPPVGSTGSWCALDRVIGGLSVERYGEGTPSFSAEIWDATDPWVGEPTLENAHCAYHAFTPDSCGSCDSDEVCAVSGECVPARRRVKDLELTLTVDGVEQSYSADAQGLIYGNLEGSPSEISATLSWSGGSVSMPATGLPGDTLGATVSGSGDYDAPGKLEVRWTDPGEGAWVRTRIPINHHASGPTFTECRAEDHEEAFDVDAAMVDPLAVITGLEFQGLHHVHPASVEVDAGCVQLLVGTQLYTDVQYTR
jgi:hypothetical protein